MEHQNNYDLNTDYKQLFERVMSGEIISAFVDFTYTNPDKIYRDICKLRFCGESIEATARGICYLSLSNFDVELHKHKYTLEEIFIMDCQQLNLGWITPEKPTRPDDNDSKLRAAVKAVLAGNSLTADDRVKLMEALK